jgi:CarD family transcriptional regulator
MQTAAPRLAVSHKPVAKPAVKKTEGKTDFRVGNYVVYPTHGVGRIAAEETQQIGDISLKVFVIAFEKDKMTLRVPVTRALAAGLRNISSNTQMEKAFVTLKGKARPSKGMWSRRAQEYEAKINSGSLISVAEVVRDLHKNVDQAERSYSERMIYESAFNRLVGELAAAEKLDTKTATEKLVKVLRQQVQATATTVAA